MSEVIPFPKGSGTPASLIEQIERDIDDIDQIVVIVTRKNKTVKGYWSEMNSMELVFSSKVLDWEVNSILEENAT